MAIRATEGGLHGHLVGIAKFDDKIKEKLNFRFSYKLQSAF